MEKAYNQVSDNRIRRRTIADKTPEKRNPDRQRMMENTHIANQATNAGQSPPTPPTLRVRFPDDNTRDILQGIQNIDTPLDNQRRRIS